MLTKIIIEGAMGAKFGRVWNLAVSTPQEALRLIDANKPGLLNWIRQNAAIYDRYKVVCTYENDRKEHLDEASFGLLRRAKVIRFVPIPLGAGAAVRIIVGVALIISSFYGGGPWALSAGISMVLGGVIQALTPIPKKKDSGASTQSNYFNGPENTIQQGVPVPLIYGRCLVGSHAISANLSINKIL